MAASILTIHPQNPQKRLLTQAVNVIERGGVIAYPTDSGYALGCMLANKKGLERIRQIRQLDPQHNFTLVCASLAAIAIYAKVDNAIFRLLKAHTPGAYTFILPATSEVPRLMLHAKRRSIGVRVPDHPVANGIIAMLNQPLMSVTFIAPGEEVSFTTAEEITESYSYQLDLIIDGGACSLEPTTVVDLRQLPPLILRHGRGEVHSWFN